MVEWHHQLDGHKIEQALGDGEEQGSLVYCIPWGCKELDTTELLGNTTFHTLLSLSFWDLFPSFFPSWSPFERHVYVCVCGMGMEGGNLV